MDNRKRPNILWVCTDQQRSDTLGCYGNSFVNTPNIDKLAENGVIFENAYTQNPICSPSRACFLTGRYPRTTRCRQNGQSIHKDEKLISKILADDGYVCGLSGKLHLSAVHPTVTKAMEKRIDDGYSVFNFSPGVHKGWPAQDYFLWLKEKGIEFEIKKVKDSNLVYHGMDEEYHQVKWAVDKAMLFMEACGENKDPWMFSINVFDPHHPFDPPKKYLDKYMDILDEIPLPKYKEGELKDKPSVQTVDHKAAMNNSDHIDTFIFDEISEKEHKLIKAAYWAMVENIDTQMGRLLGNLEKTGQLENTIIIFNSDHGEMLGDHGIYLKGPYFYEGLVRIPLIVSWPGTIEGGRRSSALVELTDLAQTLLDAIGIKHHPGMQGKSLWRLLKGEAPLDHHRDDVYCEYYNSLPFHKDPAHYATMVFDGRYKLVRMHGEDEGELYDLKKDPSETVNRWNDSEYIKIKVKMLNRLSDRMAWTIDPLPIREAIW